MNAMYQFVPMPLRALIRTATLRSSRAIRGSFRYYNQQIYAPRRSVVFERIIRDHTFEPEILFAMRTLAAPGTSVLDIGANIGVMSAALLQIRNDITVFSIECSPSTLPFLRKTHAGSPHKLRWKILEAAVGKVAGELPFFTAGSANGAYDGLNDTGRGGKKSEVIVRVRTLDEIWEQISRPNVSLIKIDIEGGEFDSLSAGTKLLTECKPFVLFEWNSTNLLAYKRDPYDIFHLSRDGFELFTVPQLQPVTPSLLPMLMAQTEMFLLAPLCTLRTRLENANALPNLS